MTTAANNPGRKANHGKRCSRRYADCKKCLPDPHLMVGAILSMYVARYLTGAGCTACAPWGAGVSSRDCRREAVAFIGRTPATDPFDTASVQNQKFSDTQPFPVQLNGLKGVLPTSSVRVARSAHRRASTTVAAMQNAAIRLRPIQLPDAPAVAAADPCRFRRAAGGARSPRVGARGHDGDGCSTSGAGGRGGGRSGWAVAGQRAGQADGGL